MQLPTIPKIGRLSKKHKITAAGVAAAAAVALAVTGLEATGGGSAVAVGDPTGFSVSSGDQVKSVGAKPGTSAQHVIADQAAAQKKAAASAAAKKKAAAEAAAKKVSAEAAAKKVSAEAAAKKHAAADAAKRANERAAANRSTTRTAIKHTSTVKTAPKTAPKTTVEKAVPVAAVTYPDNLDGWIRQARAILGAHGIPVPTYNGIYRNVMRESSGNPNAINLWDSNAAAGIPSKGLLQTIDPTFQAYHVSGTSWNVYNPVANIAAACNYAYHVYGGMDNVNSAY